MSPFIDNLKAGDVFVVPFYTHEENCKEGEARWAICIEDLHDTMRVIPLTTQIHQQSRYKKSFIILKDSKEGKLMGLISDSLVIVDRTAYINKLRGNKTGVCSEEIMDKIFDLL